MTLPRHILLSRPKPFLGFKSWKFKDPDTGFEFKGANIQQILSHIRSYREQNSLEPLEMLDTVVTNYNCMLPENLGVCTATPEKLKRGVYQYIKGGIALLKNMLYPSFATQEEADRRSLICKECVLNVFPDKTKFIKWSDDLAEQCVENRRSKYHESLGNCEACSCPLRAKVWWNGKVELTNTERTQMESANPKCWQIPLSK